MLSRDAVIWAYRLLLDREPESEEAIAAHQAAADMPALRRALLDSAEYLAGTPRPLTIGRYVDQGPVAVETDCDGEQRAAMLARIAAAWRRYGETEPHWSVLVGDRFRADRIADHVDEFYASGHGDVGQVLAAAARAGRATGSFGTMLDFGCGVGRLSLALAGAGREVVGIDISPGHLALARERAVAVGIDNARFVAIDAVDDLDAFGDIDLVVSLIVLQHNPPPVMAVLLAKLLAMLAPGGLAVIQVPTFLPDWSFSVDTYLATPQPPMEMNALPQRTVFETVAAAGCRVMEVREDGRIGWDGVSQTFVIGRPA